MDPEQTLVRWCNLVVGDMLVNRLKDEYLFILYVSPDTINSVIIFSDNKHVFWKMSRTPGETSQSWWELIR